MNWRCHSVEHPKYKNIGNIPSKVRNETKLSTMISSIYSTILKALANITKKKKERGERKEERGERGEMREREKGREKKGRERFKGKKLFCMEVIIQMKEFITHEE